MSTPDDRLREVFDQAAEVPDPADRPALLDRECGGDAALRERVEALLRAHDAAGSFLGRPAAPAPEETGGYDPRGGEPGAAGGGPATEPGTLVAGRYKLLEMVGEGGMGTVWMAEQTAPVKRRVAVKLIKPGMDSRAVVARFEAERQALALMDHPNIARVLDGGVAADGRPFFVMELVKGTPITKYCDDKRLPLADRLKLFADVCRAVQHAHQKGVIHRDLKPSNVLVAPYDGRPVVKVIDFGVAKAAGAALTERTLFTGFGAVVGTPEYMSPEQAELNNQDVDTRSDVYSLGVLLYELLTGTTPLTRRRVQQAALMEVLRLVREEDPPRPSTRLSSTAELPAIAAVRGAEPARLPREVRGELDCIVMRALEKDRARRYDTANGLAADVDRYLAGEPVLAVPPSAGYRLKKFARRNRAGLSAAALGLPLLVAVVSVVGWAVRDRSARRDEANRERAARSAKLGQEVGAAVREVDAARGRALTRTADSTGWEAALAEARSALARADGFAAQDPDALGPDLRDRLAGAHAALADDEADRRFADRVEEVRLAQVEIDVRKSEFVAGRALPALTAALRDGYGIEIGATPPDDAAAVIRRRPRPVRDILSAALEHARAPENRAPPPQAVADWVAAVLDRADDDPWRRRAREKAAAADWAGLGALAAETAAARQPAAVLVALATRMPYGSETRIGFLRHARQAHPADFWVNHELAIALHFGPRPRPAEAARYYTASLAARPGNPAEWVNLSGALQAGGEPDGAMAAAREAVRLAKDYPVAHIALADALRTAGHADEAAAECRKAIELDPGYAVAHNNLGVVLFELGKPDEAVAECRKAIELDPGNAAAHNNLGVVLFELGKPDEAVAECRKAIELDPKSASAHFNLGNALAGQGKTGEAAAEYRTAIALDPKNAAAHNSLGAALAAQNKVDEAVACYRRAIELDPKDALAPNNLGVALGRQGKLDEAAACHRQAIALDPKDASAHLNLGAALAAQNKLEEAIACFSKALALDPKTPLSHNNLGAALLDQGKLEEAAACLRRAVELDPAPRYAEAHNNLGLALQRRGKFADALTSYREAIRLKPDYADAHNNAAWVLATAPDAKLRQPSEAVKLARRAIELDSQNAGYPNTLGVALYRAGDWKGAAAALEKSVALRHGGDANDWFFLAMARWRLGEKGQARRWYDKAAECADKNAPNGDELIRFRQETEALLGIPGGPRKAAPPPRPVGGPKP